MQLEKGLDGMILKLLLLIVFLGVFPVLLGLPWMTALSHENRNRFLACFPLGYFIELAIFHLLAVPFAFFYWSFTALSIVFSCMLTVLAGFSVRFVMKLKPFRLSLPRFTGWELVYLVFFCALLAYQLYNVVIRDTTGWSYDDAIYVPYGADAARYDRILSIDPNKGIAIAAINAKRALQSSLFFPGFLTLITGIPATTINRTVLEAFDVFLAYVTFAYMASLLFKSKENGLVFLILMSVLHIFGFYSQYSITFRILGPNYQGKAVLAVSLFPLLFAFMIQKLKEEYDWRAGCILMLLSLSATALTMFGTATFILNLSLVIVLSLFRKKRKWKHLWYLLWGCTMPAIYGGIYLIYEYFTW